MSTSSKPRFSIPDPTRTFEPSASLPPYAPSAPLCAFEPKPLAPSTLIGRRIDDVQRNEGSYGMGGPGFFSLTLDGTEKLVVALWSAASWLALDGLLIEASPVRHPPNTPELCGLDGDDAPLRRALLGKTIADAWLDADAFGLVLADGTKLALTGDLDAAADLRRDIFLMPNTELWI